MKKKIVSALLTATMVCGMSVVPAVGVAAADDTITVGFSQVGAESDWRTANTESMKSTFSEENGYELIFDDAQQKQENQLTAIRNFIQQEVDYILLAPVTETGWDTVLQEAKDADIPVIIVDRMVDVSDDSLYTTWIGTDSLLEGRKAAEWLNAYTTAKGIDAKDVNIVDIQGTIGSTAQIGRSKGLEEGVDNYGWNLLAQQSGEFTQAKGQEVMESMLKQYDNINVVYCENDNEAFGAIDAIEAAGKTVGSDIANVISRISHCFGSSKLCPRASRNSCLEQTMLSEHFSRYSMICPALVSSGMKSRWWSLRYSFIVGLNRSLKFPLR